MASLVEIKNYIGGQWVSAIEGEFLDNHNPATGEVYSLVPDSDVRDVAAAVEAARLAFPAWRDLGIKGRSAILRRISELITRDLRKLAEAESVDSGKPLSLALSLDIPRAAQNFEFFADAILQMPSEVYRTKVESKDVAVNTVLRDPLGVVSCISPWNLPLYLFTWKIAPALAAGNCVVAKPSEITPMTAHLLTELCVEAGLPTGVLNVVHGLGPKVGAAMTVHPQVKAISFTGSTRVGGEIARVAAATFKKYSLEMGGKNPNIIFADCDFEEALKTSVRSSFLNQGQICLCGSRIFVERSIYEKFRGAFVESVKKLKQGDPLVEGMDQGAVVSQAHFKKVMNCISVAVKEGGKILTGGRAAEVAGRCSAGWFIAPTVIEGLDASCKTNQEEIFGPVVTLMPFDSESEVIESANSTRYGLSATVWTKDSARAQRVASALDAGVVWINCWMVRDLRTPFGGMKESGVGREGGLDALHFFTEAKNVCTKI